MRFGDAPDVGFGDEPPLGIEGRVERDVLEHAQGREADGLLEEPAGGEDLREGFGAPDHTAVG